MLLVSLLKDALSAREMLDKALCARSNQLRPITAAVSAARYHLEKTHKPGCRRRLGIFEEGLVADAGTSLLSL